MSDPGETRSGAGGELERLRARAERAEADFRLFFENVNDVICSIDAQRRIVSVSPSVWRMLGYRPEQLVGRKLEELALIGGADLERAAADIARVLAGQSVVDEFDLRAADGSIVRGQASASPLIEDGRIVGIILVGRDVTDRWRTEQELRRSEARHRALLSAMPDMIFTVSRDGVYRAYYPAENLDPPIPPERFLGRSVREVFPPAFAEHTMELIERAFATGQVQSWEYRFPLPTTDGAERINELRMTVSGPDEVMVIVRNVTERVRMQRALSESAATLRAMLQAIPDELLQVSKDGVYLAAMPTRRHETSQDPTQSVGKTLWDALPAERADRFHRAIQEALRTGRVETVEYDVVLARRRQRFREARIVAAGEDRVLILVRDITDRKQRERQDQAYREQLRSLASELSLAEERERRRIAAELHDHVGQALALARIRLGALREAALPDHLGGPLNEVCGLVEQTIAATRTLTFQLSPPVLYELGFEAAVEWLADQVGRQYGLSVQVETACQAVPMDGDVRVVLFAALRELLLNAARHSGAKVVRVRVRRRAGNIHVHVADDGSGFEDNSVGNQGQAERGPDPGRDQGGFGLFSLRERMSHLGGSLRIHSVPGRGTVVSLAAPLRRASRGKSFSQPTRKTPRPRRSTGDE